MNNEPHPPVDSPLDPRSDTKSQNPNSTKAKKQDPFMKEQESLFPEIENNEIYHFLKSIKEFSNLSSDELKALASSSRFSTVEPGQYITIEGDEMESSGFIVVTGLVAVIKTSISGKELIVELLQPNDIFELMVMLTGGRLPFQFSSRALHKSKILRVPIIKFLALLRSNGIRFEDLVTNLLLCLQSSYQLSRGLAHDRVEVRIASILLSLAIKFSDVDAKEKSKTIHFTRQQLADLTGTTPETAIRITRAMHRDGLINIKRPGVIEIVNFKALQQIAEE